MSNGEYRHVWRIVFRNFINSFRPRQIRGDLKGKDYNGNTYYEILANSNVGQRKSRWYDPPKGMDFQDPIPAEWEAWLRYRRREPPTVEEIEYNLSIMKLKKENGDKIEAKRLAEGGSLPSTPKKGRDSYPKYPEYKS